MVGQEKGVYDCRIDVYTVSSREFIGYEIKSDADTLKRLPQQIVSFNRLFDRMYLVCGSKHLDEALQLIPDWWGVIPVNENGELYRLKSPRISKRNPCKIEYDAYIRTMNPATCRVLLERHEIAYGYRGQTRYGCCLHLKEVYGEAKARRLIRAINMEYIRDPRAVWNRYWRYVDEPNPPQPGKELKSGS